ncbi:hypothetical protein RQP46_009797 [Phenoliferia psychrophenolica]
MAYEYEYGHDYNGDGVLEPWEVESVGYGVDPVLAGGVGAYGGYEGFDDYGLDGGLAYEPGFAYEPGLGYEMGVEGYGTGYLGGEGFDLARYDMYPDQDLLYEDMHFLEHEIPLVDAWGSYDNNAWADEQYALGDLMYYQRQLELDQALSEQERLARWEDRLAWEELDDAERRLRYAQMDARSLDRLGLRGGWYGQRFGGLNVDLGYLRNVNLGRGLFAAPYRSRFSHHRGLLGRFGEYITPAHIHGYGGRPVVAPVGVGLGARSIPTRLRMAETRASLAGLDAQTRARAIDDARRIRALLNAEAHERRVIDREERREDAVLQAQQEIARRREMDRERDAENAVRRIEQIAYGPGAGLPSGARDYEGSHGSTYRNSVTALSKTELTAFEHEFKEFYKRAYEAGIRTGALWEWATEAVADELSGGKTKFIILNGSYMTKSFSDPLKRKIDEVLISVDRGTLSIDHGVLVSSLILLGTHVDSKLRAQAGGATPDTVLDGEPPSSRDDFRFRFKYDTGNVEDRGERNERKRLLRLGLDAGAGEGEARLCYVEIPLRMRADWDVVERDGIEEITVL